MLSASRAPILLLCLLAAVGCCSQPNVKTIRFDGLPRISSLTNTPLSSRCAYIEVTSRRTSRVFAVGKVDGIDVLKNALPCVTEQGKLSRADTLNDRIPRALQRAVGSGGQLFSPEDSFWYCTDLNPKNGRVFCVYIAYSPHTRIYYLEYYWEL